jgi:hypothetical protein
MGFGTHPIPKHHPEKGQDIRHSQKSPGIIDSGESDDGNRSEKKGGNGEEYEPEIASPRDSLQV